MGLGVMGYDFKAILDFEALSRKDQKALADFERRMRIEKPYIFQKEGKRNKREINGRRRKIYLIQASDGSIKIGIAKNPEKRLQGLQVACPLELKLLGCWEGDSSEERRLHKKYEKSRNRNEWYHLTEEMMDLISKKGMVNDF